MDAYFAARHSDLLHLEAATALYPAEVAEWIERHGRPWDLVIAHPPCTYLANSGVRWLHTDPTRWAKMLDGADFFRLMWDFKTPRLCVENPVQHRYAVERHGMGRPHQTVQPWQFGHLETKRTAYWLRGLPPLAETDNVKAAFDATPVAQRSRIHYASPSPDRWKLRSTSYAGIAAAMADQWGALLERGCPR
ncbi:hypothetical protein ACQCX5_14455 [Propionibacteriaceae bacterium G57]|uniref:hypothetical protein n=1 Tax=Aestuariimicrobium sp. G57 TaxID=3418485 RepID=UPI003DA77909